MTTGLQQERIVTPNNSSTTKLNTELQTERHLHPFVLKVAFRAPVFCIQSQINHSSNKHKHAQTIGNSSHMFSQKDKLIQFTRSAQGSKAKQLGPH